MNTANILRDLRSERERIDKAIIALEALDSTPLLSSNAVQRKSTAAPTTHSRNLMSPAARKRMSEMMKNRWALRKKTVKPKVSAKKASAKKAARKGGLTPAGRKRLSAMMKKRWADKKKAAANAV